jgi:hypothetical protein
MDDHAEQSTPDVPHGDAGCGAHDWYIDESHWGRRRPATAPAAHRHRRITEERPFDGDLDLREPARRLGVLCPLSLRSGIAVSGSPRCGPDAASAGRARSGRGSGRPASSDRVSPDVGSGRSCVRLVGWHTPLQVPPWGTCGAVGVRTAGSSSDGLVDRVGPSVGASSCA